MPGFLDSHLHWFFPESDTGLLSVKSQFFKEAGLSGQPPLTGSETFGVRNPVAASVCGIVPLLAHCDLIALLTLVEFQELAFP